MIEILPQDWYPGNQESHKAFPRTVQRQEPDVNVKN